MHTPSPRIFLAPSSTSTRQESLHDHCGLVAEVARSHGSGVDAHGTHRSDDDDDLLDGVIVEDFLEIRLEERTPPLTVYWRSALQKTVCKPASLECLKPKTHREYEVSHRRERNQTWSRVHPSSGQKPSRSTSCDRALQHTSSNPSAAISANSYLCGISNGSPKLPVRLTSATSPTGQ